MYKDFIKELSVHFYPALVFAAVLAAAAMQIERCGVKETVRRIHWKKALFFLYTSFILFTALLGRSTMTKPFIALLDNFWPMGKQEWENILIFVPISFLALWAYRPKRRMRTAAALGFGLSLFIEVSQLVSRLGQVQLSDLLFNTLGAVLGGALFCGACGLVRSVRAARGGRTEQNRTSGFFAETGEKIRRFVKSGKEALRKRRPNGR